MRPLGRDPYSKLKFWTGKSFAYFAIFRDNLLIPVSMCGKNKIEQCPLHAIEGPMGFVKVTSLFAFIFHK